MNETEKEPEEGIIKKIITVLLTVAFLSGAGLALEYILNHIKF